MLNNQNTPSGGAGQVPNPSGGTPPAGATPGGSPPPGQPPAQSPKNETTIAGIAHLSSLFAPVIGPLIIWLAARDGMPYAARQAKQALSFHLVMVALGLVVGLVLVGRLVSSIYAAVSQAVTSDIVPSTTIPAWLLALFTLALILGLTGQVLSIYGAVQAFQGKDFSYPLLGWL
jgi:uncharacterized Tic20 family protein